MGKFFAISGAVYSFLAVALGAFGAHALKEKVSADLLEVYQTGVQYQMFHALALLFVAFYAQKAGASAVLTGAGLAFFIGIILFSGSLYTMTFTGIRTLGAITPFGGLAFLSGWVMLLITFIRSF